MELCARSRLIVHPLERGGRWPLEYRLPTKLREDVMKFLSDEMISGLLPAENSSFPSPVPTQIVSSDEYLPVPQTAQQREVEARLIEMGDRLVRRPGVSRRRLFSTAARTAP